MTTCCNLARTSKKLKSCGTCAHCDTVQYAEHQSAPLKCVCVLPCVQFAIAP